MLEVQAITAIAFGIIPTMPKTHAASVMPTASVLEAGVTGQIQ
jgi:hypothetical protein